MTNPKKPDSVVYNDKTQTNDASLKPYGTNVGAPVITTIDSFRLENKKYPKSQ